MIPFGLITALLLPALLGISWLQLLWRNSHMAARIGYGYFLGIFAVTLILRIWDSIGFSLSFAPISGFIIGLSLIPFMLKGRIKPAHAEQIDYTPFDATWQRIVWILLITLLVVRYGGILLEIIWRPLYPWDAWMNWAPKAKTWFELKDLAPFVSRIDWSTESIENHAYTLGNPRASTYPPLVPLVQTWTALGIGSWMDNLVNLPWIFCLFAFCLSFYGQARMLGAKPLTAQLPVFLLFSMPYINTHTALAGYAELWLATFYCIAVMAFINWSLTKNKVQGILVLIFACACIQTKEPGVVWAATLLPAVALSLLPGRWRYAALVAVLISVVVWFYLGGISIDIPFVGDIIITSKLISLPGIGHLDIEYHPVAKYFVTNDLFWDNWHILGWLILVSFIPLFIRNIGFQSLLPASILVLCGFIFIVIVFFLTKHYNSALDSTTINRASVHLLPVLIYYLLISYTYDRKAVR